MDDETTLLSRCNSARPRAVAVAKLAGTDTWKTWAGRKDGSDNFQLSDLWFGAQAHARHALRSQLSDTRADGKTCPICDEDDPEPDAEGKRWLRLFCGCTVCSSCVRQWSMSMLDEKAQNEHVKLTCPSCSALMRTGDAQEALARHPSVSARYDLLSRDTTLRTMPEWRSCPRCDGGGFTTPECLAPRHEQVQREATTSAWRLQGCMLILIWLVVVNLFRAHPPQTTFVAMVGTAAVAACLATAVRRAVATISSTPLQVECPNCDADFLLKDYNDALQGSAQADAQTQRWIASNTRPCPSCGSAIQKISGCNAMRCGSCRVSFCWACMKSGSGCDHFSCRHGAPYGNAVPRRDGLGWLGDIVDAHNPGEEAVRRITAQATFVVGFSAFSALMTIGWVAMDETRFVVLWTMWVATTARPVYLCVHLVAGLSLPLLLRAAWRARERPMDRERRYVHGAALAAAAVTLTDLGEQLATVLASILQSILAGSAICYIIGMSHWWWTQPERLALRMKEQTQHPRAAHSMGDQARAALQLFFGQ
jgi:Zn finger protein HypA/HybF involved in hydrogenase expression